MNLEDLPNIEDYYIDKGFLCIKLMSGDHLRINFNNIDALKKQLNLTDVSHQRELLKAYAELIQSSYTHHFFDDAVEESIDEFLSL